MIDMLPVTEHRPTGVLTLADLISSLKAREIDFQHRGAGRPDGGVVRAAQHDGHRIRLFHHFAPGLSASFRRRIRREYRAEKPHQRIRVFLNPLYRPYKATRLGISRAAIQA